MHVFVFVRGSILAKEKELIDYVGVIIEGRAISSNKNYESNTIIGAESLLGLKDVHSLNITAECDGIILALRLSDFHKLERANMKFKFLSFLTEDHLLSLKANINS